MATITNEQVLTRLVESEAGRAAKAAIERDYTAERMNIKAQIETLRRERGQQGRELADGVEVTRKRLEQARKILTEAEQEHRVAVMQQKQTAAHFDGRIKKLQGQLLATAPAAITEFLGWLEDMESETKATPITEHAEKTNRISTRSDQTIRRYYNNAAALRDRLQAIRKARAEAESLKPLILDADDLQQRLDTLRELPPVSMQFAYEK